MPADVFLKAALEEARLGLAEGVALVGEDALGAAERAAPGANIADRGGDAPAVHADHAACLKRYEHGGCGIELGQHNTSTNYRCGAPVGLRLLFA